MNKKLHSLLTFRRILAGLALVVLIVLSAGVDAIFAQAFTQGYNADSSLQRGMIVQLVRDDTTKVQLVGQQDAAEAYGVVVHKNDAPATIASEGQQVFVATEGTYEVLVSSQNGQILPGDYIVISSTAGIGMKVDKVQPVVVARAIEGFSGKGGDSVSQITQDDTTFEVGRIRADIAVGSNPLHEPPGKDVPEFLRQAAETIAQKPISTPRLYLSLALLAISTIISGTLLYGGVRSAIISVGRNPLSKRSIIKGMLQVVLVGLMIFILGVFGVYLLLRL